MTGNCYAPIDAWSFRGELVEHLVLEYSAWINKLQVSGEDQERKVNFGRLVLGRELRPGDKINWVEVEFTLLASQSARMRATRSLTKDRLGDLFGEDAKSYAKGFVESLKNNDEASLNLKFEPSRICIDRARMFFDSRGDIITATVRVRSDDFARLVESQDQI
jgi:hypothetical protein